MENDAKKKSDSDLLSEALKNPALVKLAQTSFGRNIMIRKAIKMLRHSFPELTEEQLADVENAAATGDMDKVDEKLIELGVLKNE